MTFTTQFLNFDFHFPIPGPRMGVYTPKKGDHVRVNGNVAITPIDAAATKTTTTTLTTSIAVTASTTISSATNGCRFEPQSTEKSRPQKKARKTMPSSRKEAECILLSPTNEELNRTVTPGKVRKRASMGGCASKKLHGTQSLSWH